MDVLPVPFWAVLGLLAALFSTAIPLIQERMQADGFAVAFWVKASALILAFPLALHYGLPLIQSFILVSA